MEKLIFENDIKVFGKEVTIFPAGIDEAFKELINTTGDKAGERNYYGISYMNNGKMIYKALAEEKNNDEASKYNYAASIIEKGDYFFETLKNWRNNTNCINTIFHEMMKDDRIDKTTPAVEWYKNDEEMLCMIKAL